MSRWLVADVLTPEQGRAFGLRMQAGCKAGWPLCRWYRPARLCRGAVTGNARKRRAQKSRLRGGLFVGSQVRSLSTLLTGSVDIVIILHRPLLSRNAFAQQRAGCAPRRYAGLRSFCTFISSVARGAAR